MTEYDAQKLLNKLTLLKQQAKESGNTTELKKHERLCIEQFKYLINMKTNKYKFFNNYEDLKQEGFLALLTAIDSYLPSKGSFFYWAHQYIDTRLNRMSNAHTLIRYPLKPNEERSSYKEMPIQHLIISDNKYCPHFQLESAEINHNIQSAIDKLPSDQKEIINSFYGLNQDKQSISNINKKLKITRLKCLKKLDRGLFNIKEIIKI